MADAEAGSGGSEAWLALGPASRQLGVDPDTLRRWADAGRIRAYSTPGGHRRFARADLDRVQRDRRPRRRRLATLGATPDRLTRAYARSYRGAAGAASLIEGEDRAAFREAGRRLVERMLAFLDATGAARKAALEQEARELVTATARRLASTGTTVAVALEAFIAARQPFLRELEVVVSRRDLSAAQSTALYADAANLFDRLLVQFLATFQDTAMEDA